MRTAKTRRLADLEQTAERIHAGQLDKQDVPYIDHVRAVAAAVREDAKPVALFHDALEDRRIAPRELEQLLTSTEMRAVRLVTRDKTRETYEQFIDRIRTAPDFAGELARDVKIADLEHNLGRLTPSIESAKPQLRPRYERALAQLR